MKHKNKIKNLEARIAKYEQIPQDKKPGFTKPGSNKK